MFDVGLTDTVVHALDECEERNMKDMNSGGGRICQVKAFFHGFAIGLMDLMLVFGGIYYVMCIVAGVKGKKIDFVDK